MKNSAQWRLIFQVYSSKNNERLAMMMLEVFLFLLESNDLVNNLEKMERKIKEFEMDERRHTGTTSIESNELDVRSVQEMDEKYKFRM